MLEKDFEYYLQHQDELVQKYSGKFLLIFQEQVVGDYPTFEEAIREASKKYGLGNVLIQKCEPGTQAYTQTFQSRVAFK